MVIILPWLGAWEEYLYKQSASESTQYEYLSKIFQFLGIMLFLYVVITLYGMEDKFYGELEL